MTDESLVVHQPAFTCHSIQHSRRLDQRLHMLRDEVRIMVSTSLILRHFQVNNNIYIYRNSCQ